MNRTIYSRRDEPEECTCRTAYKSFERSCTEPNLISFHIKESIYNEPNKKTKRLSLRKFERHVSALRNSGGGILFVHISDRANEDLNIAEFDQYVDQSLKRLIADGCSFIDSYSRNWLCLEKDFQQFTDILILTVAKGTCVSSVSLNTKVCSDHEIEFPSTFELLRLLLKGPRKVSEDTVRPVDRQFHQDNQDWREDRHIELKTFHVDTFRKYCSESKHNSWKENFVNYVWKNLRFQEYLTCMSKVPLGGSFYVGITEGKKSVVPDVHGIDLKSTKTDIAELFKLKLTTVTIYSFDDTFKNGQQEENVMEIKFHDLKTGNSVLEFAVKCVRGIVFYDDGPLAYIIDDKKHIVKIDKVQWMTEVKSLRLK